MRIIDVGKIEITAMISSNCNESRDLSDYPMLVLIFFTGNPVNKVGESNMCQWKLHSLIQKFDALMLFILVMSFETDVRELLLLQAKFKRQLHEFSRKYLKKFHLNT